MGTTTAQTIINRASTLLQDVTNIRWLRTELLDWLNEAQQYIVSVKPGASAKTVDVTLQAGSFQNLPSDGSSLIDVVRNTSGRAVRGVTREILDAQIPNWHASQPSGTVYHFVYDAHVPKVFYVYPPSNGTAAVQLQYAAQPTVAGDETQTISLDDTYAPAILNYVVYRAYSKDTDYTSNETAAGIYYQMFKDALAGKQAFEDTTNPNVALAPFNPNVAQGTK